MITCSSDVAEWEAGDTVDSLLRRADVALYETNRSGRNRVVAADTFAPGKSMTIAPQSRARRQLAKTSSCFRLRRQRHKVSALRRPLKSFWLSALLGYRSA